MPPPGPRSGHRGRACRIAVIVLLLLSVLVVYWQVGSHSFVNWDDDLYVYANAQVRKGLSLQGISWAFTTAEGSLGHPLTWLSHMADVSLFGLDAGWHHRVNVLLHMVNAVLLFLLLESVTGALWRSGFVAAAFALHPLHVESVAWIAERKDVLSTMFWLLATWAYVEYARRGGARRYAAVLLLFGLGLLSKPMLVTLPFTLLLLDWWPLGRLRAGSVAEGSPGASFGRRLARLVVEKAPFLAMAAVSSAVTYLAQAGSGAARSWMPYPFGLRVSNAIASYAAYLGKTVWPASLAAFYPFPEIVPAWRVVLGILLLGGASFLALRYRGRFPWLAAGWLWYLGTLVPVIGLVPVGTARAMADRYTYVPLIGILLAVAWGAADLRGRRALQAGRGIAAAAALAALAAASWVQAGYWKDGVTLFRRALQVTENNFVAHHNFANALARVGRLGEAEGHLREAVRIKPGDAAALADLGMVLNMRGDPEGAVAACREAVRLEPGDADAHNKLGIALAARGEIEEAVARYREAIRIRPDFADAHSNLGTALAMRGRRDEAMASYREALRIDPELAVAHNNLGVALLDLGKHDDAIAHFREALRINPGFGNAQLNLRDAQAARGRP